MFCLPPALFFFSLKERTRRSGKSLCSWARDSGEDLVRALGGLERGFCLTEERERERERERFDDRRRDLELCGGLVENWEDFLEYAEAV